MHDNDITDLAREGLYRFLAAALRDPASRNGQYLYDPAGQQFAAAASAVLRAEAPETDRLGFGELPAESLTLEPILTYLREDGDSLPAEYHRVFGLLPPRECLPYETEYHETDEAFFRAQQMADIAGFYRAFGLEPAHHERERPDYLPLELEFVAFVLMKKRTAPAPLLVDICADAEAAFFRDHLAWWLPAFAVGLRRKASTGFYAAVAEVLAALLPLERARFGVAAPARAARRSLPIVESAEDATECASAAY